ncbi:MAG: glycosyl transferase [Dehalococcoidia bacterium]|nr:MAG: glycosyl transferase [Dehalococcoidia bacterium]
MHDCWADGWTVHQLTVGALRGDGITDLAFSIRHWLREAGARAEIYAEHIAADLVGDVLPYHELRIDPAKRERVIWHFSIGSPVSAFARRLPWPSYMMYHNITPPELFYGADAEVIEVTRLGRWELGSFDTVDFAMANSEYSRRELEQAGYTDTAVLPLPVDPERFSATPDPAVLAEYDDGRTTLLTVSKIAPHKRQEDAIKALAAYKRIDPSARLVVVGGVMVPAYRRWLDHLARHLGVEHDVIFTDRVSDAALRAYYQIADVYLCMSEHEGFGVPVIEAMWSGVPVIAYAATATPDTLGEAGILIHRKHFPVIAELIDRIVRDPALRERLIATGKRRVEAFSPAAIRALFRSYLAPRLRG